MIDLAALPFVPCQHRTARSRTDLVVVHTNEGPEARSGAENLARYLQTTSNGAGYNYIVDEDSIVCAARADEAVWGAGGVNSRAVHVCLIGYAGQDGAQWHDPASLSTGKLAADLVSTLCAKLNVPKVRSTDTRTSASGAFLGVRGICGHGDVSRYHPESQGHTDPGAAFPWEEFIAAVRGVPAPGEEPDEERKRAMTEWFYRNKATGAIYYVAGTQRVHVSPDQKALVVFAAGMEGRTIPDLGNLSDAQIKAADRFPLVGPA